MRERHMTNLSAALQCVQKVCSKEKGATHFVWQASEGTFRKVETGEGSTDRVDPWGPRVAEGLTQGHMA